MARDVDSKQPAPCRRHAWRTFGWQGDDVIFECGRCRGKRQRKMTRGELRYFKKFMDFSALSRLGQDVHRVWAAFCRAFIDSDGKYKFCGYDFMKRVERWAKRQPFGHVRIVTVDDSLFSSSSLVLIEAKDRDAYMGTNYVYIPQGGEPAASFFLYPHHRRSLIRALREIDRESRVVERRERVVRKRTDAGWRAVVELPSAREAKA